MHRGTQGSSADGFQLIKLCSLRFCINSARKTCHQLTFALHLYFTSSFVQHPHARENQREREENGINNVLSNSLGHCLSFKFFCFVFGSWICWSASCAAVPSGAGRFLRCHAQAMHICVRTYLSHHVRTDRQYIRSNR